MVIMASVSERGHQGQQLWQSDVTKQGQTNGNVFIRDLGNSG